MRERADAERVDQTLNVVTGGDDLYEQEADDGRRS
jgi:hypothetical protein